MIWLTTVMLFRSPGTVLLRRCDDCVRYTAQLAALAAPPSSCTLMLWLRALQLPTMLQAPPACCTSNSS